MSNKSTKQAELERLGILVRTLDEFLMPQSVALLGEKGYEQYLTERDSILDAAANRADALSGVRQGIRSKLQRIQGLGREVVEQAKLLLKERLGENPDIFAADETKKREKVRIRGMVRNRDEFYLVRDRIEEIEGEADDIELQELYRLIGEYETRTETKKSSKKKVAKTTKIVE